MKLFDINHYLPLNENEFIYKTIFLQNPEFELDKPKTTAHIDSILENLGLDVFNLKHPMPSSPKKEFMSEGIFPKANDVVISKHLRYSPCFIHTHSFFEIIYVLNGYCRNEISNHILEMKKGDVCIISPNTPHSLSVFTDDCIVINLLVRASTFEKSFFDILKSSNILSSFFSHALYSSVSESYLLFTKQNDSLTINSILEMYHEFHSNLEFSDRMLTSMMSSFFIRLLRTDPQNIIVPNPAGSHTDRNVIFILNYIFTNYKTINLRELSIKFNYSERQVSRILKEYTGKTFVNIIHEIKLQKACELLTNSDMSINKIIETIGYSNTTYFYKIFKKYNEINPMDYRNKYSTK